MTTPIPAPTDYKTIRLNQYRRGKLLTLAKTTLVTCDEEDREAEAFAHADALIRRHLGAVLVAKDMRILAKYDSTAKATDVSIRTEEVNDYGHRVTVDFCLCPRDVRADEYLRQPPSEEHAIEVPAGWTTSRRGHRGCHRSSSGTVDLVATGLPQEAIDEIVAAIKVFDAAAKETDAARRKVLNSLANMMSTRRTLQAVAKHWPSAMLLAEKFGGVDQRAVDSAEALAGAESVQPAPAT